MTAREARRYCSVQIHRTTVYRLLKRVEREGEQALAERRHGHRAKLRGEVLPFLLDYCQRHPAISSAAVQHLLAERFALSVSVSQLNRVRAAHGLSRQPVPSTLREKKSRKLASPLPQDIMSKRVDCCCWQQPLKPTCSLS